MEEHADRVSSQAELAAFVDLLARDLAEHPEEWAHTELDAFLETLADTVRTIDRVLANLGKPLPPEATWGFVADLLLAAKYHE